MTPELGHAALWLAAALGFVGSLAGRLRARADLALVGTSLLTLLAFAAMIASFAGRDFSVAPVNDHAHRLRPTADALAAWFATPAGGLFLGAGILAALGPLLAWKRRWMAGWALLLLLLLAALLLLDPFARVVLPPVEGRALGRPGLMPDVVQAAFDAACLGALVVVALVRKRWPLRIAATGIALLAIGAAGLASGETGTVVLRPGETARIKGVDLTLRDVRPVAGPDFTAVEALLAADGKPLAVQLRTHISRPVRSAPAATRWSAPGEIEALLLGESEGGGWRLALTKRPFAWALWAGGALLIAAGLSALILLPRSAAGMHGDWRWIPAALVPGLLGYAVSGAPLMPARPAPPLLIDAAGPPAFAAARQELPVVYGDVAAWITIAEALERGGGAADAAAVLLNGIERSPDSADLWTALGNALALHAEGTVPPAAQLAYARAARLDPKSPAPPYNHGLAWMLAGDPRRAAATWQALRADSAADAPWWAALDRRLTEARVMLAQAAR